MKKTKKSGKYCEGFRCNRRITETTPRENFFEGYKRYFLPFPSSRKVRMIHQKLTHRCKTCINCKPSQCKKGYKCYFCVRKDLCHPHAK